ncbi:MAG: enoyl-CoA hydratase/isomerase family protein [Herpetosiphonaceae bacterium]|nr:enoyl-CoA hydratase/isomerase family protein [Herpetosiphonaceae bacterium]
MEQIKLTRTGAVVTVTLNRPAVHNAFNPQMIGELHTAFNHLASDPQVRAVVLTGAGPSFCAGADLHWMQETLHYTEADNIADAERMAGMYECINTLPKPLIGKINGAAVGGGAGLVACCDIAVACTDARFGFAEVNLGILPAVIARFVVPKIGVGHARALFVSGRRFSAEKARDIGLVHDVVPSKDFDKVIKQVVDDVLTSGPQAVDQAKQLVQAIATLPADEVASYTVKALAQARTSAEGQEGVRAFLEKRKPAWLES